MEKLFRLINSGYAALHQQVGHGGTVGKAAGKLGAEALLFTR